MGLQPIISKSTMSHGLLIPTNSLCSTPILAVKKKDSTYHLVCYCLINDLWIINEAIIPIHPIVSKPYIFWGKLPPDSSWFSALDLKDAFSCILLAPESQYLFALEWESLLQAPQQLTWPVLLQGFRDSSHLFRQVLAWDQGFPDGSDGKESACNSFSLQGDLDLIPRSGRSPREGNGNPPQYSCLENSMDRGAWQATVHGIVKSWTQLSDFQSKIYNV